MNTWTYIKGSVPDIGNAEVLSLLERGKLDIITITSGAALQNLLAMLGQDSQHGRIVRNPFGGGERQNQADGRRYWI